MVVAATRRLADLYLDGVYVGKCDLDNIVVYNNCQLVANTASFEVGLAKAATQVAAFEKAIKPEKMKKRKASLTAGPWWKRFDKRSVSDRRPMKGKR